MGSVGEWVPFLLKLLVLGPAIGFAIGGAGSWLISKADSKMNIRLEHQALYGIGLVFAAFAASTAAGGDGFLGAFFAGLAVVILNQRLCQCFLDYGEVTAEMAMLLVFVLFGSVLSGMLGSVSLIPALGLAALVIFVIRPSVLALVLLRARISWEARAFLCWFGPRGLNSLLLALIVVQADIPGAELLLATVGFVVIASVIIHGASATPVSMWYERKVDRETLVEERESTAAGLFGSDGPETRRIGPGELSRMLEGDVPPIILDVRSRSSYDRDGAQIPDSVRVLPDQVLRWASENTVDRPVVAYCT